MPDPRDIQEICGRLDRGEIDRRQFLEAFTREMAELIGCSRASVWTFADTARGRSLHCQAMFDRTRNRMVDAADIPTEGAEPYFEALYRDGCIVASDARHHRATRAFTEGYFEPLDIHSVLDVSFTVNGVVFGIFSCEQVGAPIRWTQRQLQWLRQIGSRASLTLSTAAAAALDSEMDAMWEPSSPSRLRTLPAPLGHDEG